MTIKTTERGWAGHFIGADSCKFRRNALIESGETKIVVSTVGAHFPDNKIEPIGAFGRYYETMAFEAEKVGEYWDADVSNQVHFDSQWSICADYVKDLPAYSDNLADAMHERVVAEIANRLECES